MTALMLDKTEHVVEMTASMKKRQEMWMLSSKDLVTWVNVVKFVTVAIMNKTRSKTLNMFMPNLYPTSQDFDICQHLDGWKDHKNLIYCTDN